MKLWEDEVSMMSVLTGKEDRQTLKKTVFKMEAEMGGNYKTPTPEARKAPPPRCPHLDSGPLASTE